MKLSAHKIRKYQSAIKDQRVCEISVVMSFATIIFFLFGIIEADLLIILLGIELLSLSIFYSVKSTSKSYAALLDEVIASDSENIKNQFVNKK